MKDLGNYGNEITRARMQLPCRPNELYGNAEKPCCSVVLFHSMWACALS